jgi:hypothetical protein
MTFSVAPLGMLTLPAIAKAGEKLAQDLNSSLSLSFTTEFIEANGKNIFIRYEE